MPFDKLKSPEEVWEERRERARSSVRIISVDELKNIVNQHETEFVDDPWRDKFLRLMADQPNASFYCAEPEPNVVVYYCRDADIGVWVVPGSAMGPLDETGKRVLTEIIEAGHAAAKTGERNR